MQTKVQVARWPWGAHTSAVVEGGLGLLVEWCECFFCGVWCSWGAHKSAVVEGGLGLLVEWCECVFFLWCVV